ncbi:MAG: hypothetical protein ACRD0H_08700, partial [Actinomycetes bacterium]
MPCLRGADGARARPRPLPVLRLAVELLRGIAAAGRSVHPRCPDGAGPLASSTWRRAWDRARTGAGLSQVHLHDLRHGGNTLAATLRYQHATS